MNGGVLGAIAGSAIGLLGGATGTYFSIKNTKGPRERSFMVRSAAVGWFAIFGFLVLLFVLPTPYRWFMWVTYGVLLPLAIGYGNNKQQRIRLEESQKSAPGTGT